MVVLVVDDYAETREVLKILLEMVGHTVLEAANGGEAVRLAITQLPDLILMDLAMPGMDGFVATTLIRADAATVGMRIVALSANGNDPAWRNAALRSGCDECHSKPLDFECLTALVDGTS